MSERVSDKLVDELAEGMKEYPRGTDPWLLSDGTIIEPQDVLDDLRESRSGRDAARAEAGALRGALVQAREALDETLAALEGATEQAGHSGLTGDIMASARRALAALEAALGEKP